jgi:hypothetical protein
MTACLQPPKKKHPSYSTAAINQLQWYHCRQTASNRQFGGKQHQWRSESLSTTDLQVCQVLPAVKNVQDLCENSCHALLMMLSFVQNIRKASTSAIATHDFSCQAAACQYLAVHCLRLIASLLHSPALHLLLLPPLHDRRTCSSPTAASWMLLLGAAEQCCCCCRCCCCCCCSPQILLQWYADFLGLVGRPGHTCAPSCKKTT